jgi:hypothetical protein
LRCVAIQWYPATWLDILVIAVFEPMKYANESPFVLKSRFDSHGIHVFQGMDYGSLTQIFTADSNFDSALDNAN